MLWGQCDIEGEWLRESAIARICLSEGLKVSTQLKQVLKCLFPFVNDVAWIWQ